jgi:RNA polymerase sigma-70 factor (ECF subfamily)
MAGPPPSDAPDPDLLRRAGQGESACLHELFTRYRPRLRRVVKLRLDPRVQGRVDPSDVIQEAYLEICQKLADYLRDSPMPFFLWLRLLTGQKLALAHRQHLGVAATG